jgi:hypothetical protein
VTGIDGGTDLEIEYSSDRRFGLGRVPQQVAGPRYRDDALAAQGCTGVERERRLGL